MKREKARRNWIERERAERRFVEVGGDLLLLAFCSKLKEAESESEFNPLALMMMGNLSKEIKPSSVIPNRRPSWAASSGRRLTGC